MRTIDVLDGLIAFPTISRTSNRDLMSFVTGLLNDAAIDWKLVPGPDGPAVNLYATVGPKDRGGVVLSGHTDVVPVDGQHWHSDPFKLTAMNDRLHGRGCADMKGFVAAALSVALRAAKRELRTPLHLAFSCDEEIGCVGVRPMLERLADREPRPLMCIVGEPTGMRIATGHKGKTALRARCHGHACHSALAPHGLNALHLGADFLASIRALQHDIVNSGIREAGHEVPYTTLHAGIMGGGMALNIVPDLCEIDFEIRSVSADDPAAHISRLKDAARAIVEPYRADFPDARIEIEECNAYPGLDTDPDSGVVRLLKNVTQSDGETCKVAFGTEAGLFDRMLATPTAVCGPGFIAQGHKPDEYVSIKQLALCDAMMDRLIVSLENGL